MIKLKNRKLYASTDADADGKTSAEISPEEKNAISHRGKALRAMREKLAANI